MVLKDSHGGTGRVRHFAKARSQSMAGLGGTVKLGGWKEGRAFQKEDQR